MNLCCSDEPAVKLLPNARIRARLEARGGVWQSARGDAFGFLSFRALMVLSIVRCAIELPCRGHAPKETLGFLSDHTGRHVERFSSASLWDVSMPQCSYERHSCTMACRAVVCDALGSARLVGSVWRVFSAAHSMSHDMRKVGNRLDGWQQFDSAVWPKALLELRAQRSFRPIFRKGCHPSTFRSAAQRSWPPCSAMFPAYTLGKCSAGGRLLHCRSGPSRQETSMDVVLCHASAPSQGWCVQERIASSSRCCLAGPFVGYRGRANSCTSQLGRPNVWALEQWQLPRSSLSASFGMWSGKAWGTRLGQNAGH